MKRAGEYILEEKVGQGTYGEVWRARHHVWSDRVAAIKIPTDPQYLRTLQREGLAIHGLVHPNIVRAIGFDPYADPPYLAMEYVAGPSLRQLIGKLTVDESVSILRQVLTALAYAHERGVLHRDVKPENVLVHDGVAKLTDFGLGHTEQQQGGAACNLSIAYSGSLAPAEAARVVGTVAYMAPEVKAGGQGDARADLYACGVMLFEMLTGERPAGTEVPSDLNKQIPPALDDIFRRSYARLEKRFTSANEFLAAIDAATARPQSQGRSTVIPPPIPGTASTDTRRNCPRCRGDVQADDQFCIHCGLRLAARVRRCGKCGAYPDGSDRYCIFCGHGLEARTA